MALLTVYEINTGGAGLQLPVPSAAAAGGDSFADQRDQRTMVIVTNGGSSSVTVNVSPISPTSASVPGVGLMTVATKGLVVAAGLHGVLGPFEPPYIDQLGHVNLIYSEVTGVVVTVVHMARSS